MTYIYDKWYDGYKSFIIKHKYLFFFVKSPFVISRPAGFTIPFLSSTDRHLETDDR